VIPSPGLPLGRHPVAREGQDRDKGEQTQHQVHARHLRHPDQLGTGDQNGGGQQQRGPLTTLLWQQPEQQHEQHHADQRGQTGS